MAGLPRPKSYHTITPYLIVDDAERAIAFYTEAFGAQEVMRIQAPDAPIMHAELRIGDSIVMLAQEMPGMFLLQGPHARGGATSSILLYVDDVDAAFEHAVSAGGKVARPVQDQFYGDRTGSLFDPAGHLWTLATHVEDVSEDEMKRRFNAMMPPA